MLPAILALSSPSLTDDERALFRAADPAGYILFARNIADPKQLRALTDSLHELSGRDDLPILIDQEGGRIARMGPPHWPAFPAPARFAALYARAPMSAIEAARANGQALGLMLAEAGINVDCLPVLDLAHAGAHDVIGDRALGGEPMQVAALGRALLDGLETGGCAGVMKHVPGHGRARADSHESLPVVDAGRDELEADLAPFRACRAAPMAMTAHVLYPAWDAQCCATLSSTIVAEVIRGRIGFEGLLMSDDLGMNALAGPLAARARGAIAAGCDVALHCSGRVEDNEAIVGGLDPIGEAARGRLGRAMARAGTGGGDFAELVAKRDALLACG